MTAFTDRPIIPRIVTKKPDRKAETFSLVTDPDIRLYSNANRQMRYRHLPDVSKETDEEIEIKLRERFELLGEFTRLSTHGLIRSLTVSGPGGVGKTHEIDLALSEFDPTGENYTSHSGFSTPVGLLKMLHQHRHDSSLLKCDDIDSIFNDEKSINLLKAACDTTRQRVITYATNAILTNDETGEPIPTRFDFNGTIIFSTNIDFEQMIDKGSKMANHFEAFMTRSQYIDLKMRTKRDYLIRVFMVVDETDIFSTIPGCDPLTTQEIDDVLSFIDKNYTVLRECSLRMAIKLAILRKNASSNSKFSWERMALLSCCVGVR